jgi:hypothetical protein
MELYFGVALPIVKNFQDTKGKIRIIMGCNSRDSCSNLFKKLEILPLKSQYIFSLLLFVVNNTDLFWTNSENHNMMK